MSCFYPIKAYKTVSGDVTFFPRGTAGKVLNKDPAKRYKPPDLARELWLPCSRCIGCRLERSRQWAMRCMHEAQLYGDQNMFLTLTYDDEHIPEDWSLRYVDFQKFMRALRKKHGKCRFYMCGEYGENYSRPHYHACIFGFRFDDLKLWRTSQAKFQLFRSAKLEDLWSHGSSEVGSVTFESAAYIARYCVKEVSAPGGEWIVDPSTGEMCEREREFTRMSLKPGIGADWYAKYKSEVFPLDRVVVRGKEVSPPSFYFDLLKEQDGFMHDAISYKRELRAARRVEDNMDDRLEVREVCLRSKLKKLKRSLE